MALQPGIDRALSGADLDRNGSGTAQTSSELFVNSASLDQQGFTLLHLIVLGLHSVDLGMVLKHYPVDIDAPDVNGRTPLFWAAWRGDLLNVILLLKYGADIDRADNQLWTPLARASKTGQLDVVQYLLRGNASLTIATSQGFQPIHHASDNKKDGARVVEELLAHGADPNARSTSQGTPLHNAANRGSVATIKILLASGSEINALDDDGDTPIMTSLLCWNEPAFFELTKLGACLDIDRRNGHSVVHVAVWGASAGVWELLTNQAEMGGLQNIDLNVLHNGHDLDSCFSGCRALWYPGFREVMKEASVFRRMVMAFSNGQGLGAT